MEDVKTHEKKKERDEDGGKGLILLVAVRMVMVAGTGRQTDAEEAYDIGTAIGKGVETVRHHTRAADGITEEELEESDQPVQDKRKNECLADFTGVLFPGAAGIKDVFVHASEDC
jgi:hypothetical protein